MSLPAGFRLGPYEVVAPLGAGGMGEVYRARDVRLGREVAIKILPQAFAADGERLARFRREAHVLASLNHSHIAALYGLEESGGVEALILELAEGETLAERLAAGPLPIPEAFAIARQIAEALEAAHERGIVHRDLKPANVKLTPFGGVKVLDFGLAKAWAGEASSADLSDSPTVTAVATRAGVALGTAAYMSPEQARGKTVDKRADIFAFGAVLYEMVTGLRAFSGETVSDTLAAVLMTEPDWSALPRATPAAVRSILRRCLQKDSSRRLRDIGDARLELEEAERPLEPVPAPSAASSKVSGRALFAAAVLGVAAGALAAGLAAYRLLRSGETGAGSAMRFVSVTNFSGMEIQPSLSPDGRSVAFVANRESAWDIWVGLVTGGRLVRITDDANVEAHPKWSPDGTKIAYAKLTESGSSEIWEVPALGGSPRRVVLGATEPAWSPDGRSLAYANLATGTIWICDASGAGAREVTGTDPLSRLYRQPAFSRGGSRLALVLRQSGPYGELGVIDVATKTVRVLTNDRALAYSPAWSADDRFLYFASSRGGTINIWKIAADGRGQPQQITAGQGDDLDLSLSADGKRLVFSTYRQNINIGVADLEGAGEAARLKWITFDAARGELAPAFSPDGKKIAYFSNRKGVEREGIFVMDSDGANVVPLVADGLQNVLPRWYADGEELLFRSSDARLGRAGDQYRRARLSGGPPEVVASEPLGLRVDVGPDGRIFGRDPRGRAIVFDPRTKQRRVLEGCIGDNFRPSPDGRLLAYVGPPGERGGLWVYDFQNPPRRIVESWVVNFAWVGPEELVYAEGKPDMTVFLWRIRPDGSERRSIAVSVALAGASWELAPMINFDVSRDGRRVAIQAREQSEADIGMIEMPR